MTQPRSRFLALPLAAVVALALVVAVPASSSATPRSGAAAPRLESLDRGLVAAKTAEGVYLSWRLLRDEATGASATGLTGTDFAVYRGKKRLATVKDSTNYLDAGAIGPDTYSVVPVVRGRERGHATTVRPWDQAYLDIPLQKPADGRTEPNVRFPEGSPTPTRPTT